MPAWQHFQPFGCDAVLHGGPPSYFLADHLACISRSLSFPTTCRRVAAASTFHRQVTFVTCCNTVIVVLHLLARPRVLLLFFVMVAYGWVLYRRGYISLGKLLVFVPLLALLSLGFFLVPSLMGTLLPSVDPSWELSSLIMTGIQHLRGSLARIFLHERFTSCLFSTHLLIAALWVAVGCMHAILKRVTLLDHTFPFMGTVTVCVGCVARSVQRNAVGVLLLVPRYRLGTCTRTSVHSIRCHPLSPCGR